MKIKICGDNLDAWWEIRDEKGRTLALSMGTYARKSDAKRGAGRFERKLYNSYLKSPYPGIKIVESK